ncbi:hypothetical protein NBE98_05335 [Clostridium swellfunianum]|uniref:hypothetical protein n=1 Tax=Clostridium swellfunianum TaxID=1367462 RepID=UPI00202F6593|nr:hypothetical protein [Clostridium swellfunianum]MCM0647799.1 hypothetical protein [Clostridium swellfunianum]
MLVNMSTVKNRQRNSSINGNFASFTGIAVSFNGMFALKISYGSPTSVSVSTP